MAVEQLPGQVREFATYLNGLMERLDQGGGWCAVFWQRDPDGMRACLDGWEVPPWDLVEALLQDLAAGYGAGAASQETGRARALHAASLAAYDARPGGRDALGDRLDVMLREQRYAAERQVELGRMLRAATSPEEAEAVRLDLAWSRDDHERATARCAELLARMEHQDRRALRTQAQGALSFPAAAAGDVFRVREPGDGADTGSHPRVPEQPGPSTPPADPAPLAAPADGRQDFGVGGPGPYDTGAPGSRSQARGQVQSQAPAAPGAHPGSPEAPGPYGPQQPDPAAYAPSTPDPAGSSGPRTPDTAPYGPRTPDPAPKQRSKRRPRGGARFAGVMDGEEASETLPVVPALAAPVASARRTLRGARFAGAAQVPEPPRAQPLDDGAGLAVAETVGTLIRLRAEGRGGEAHGILVEAAYWPAARFPLLAAELHRAGLDADWATLLWEAASLPADRLVSAADALVTAGRAADGQQMLRQGVVRPAPEIGEAVLALAEQGRTREVSALLDAYVRMRTPEEAARSAEADPQHLVPLLLDAAQAVSDERHWDLVHALRVAGLTA